MCGSEGSLEAAQTFAEPTSMAAKARNHADSDVFSTLFVQSACHMFVSWECVQAAASARCKDVTRRLLR